MDAFKYKSQSGSESYLGSGSWPDPLILDSGSQCILDPAGCGLDPCPAGCDAPLLHSAHYPSDNQSTLFEQSCSQTNKQKKLLKNLLLCQRQICWCLFTTKADNTRNSTRRETDWADNITTTMNEIKAEAWSQMSTNYIRVTTKTFQQVGLMNTLNISGRLLVLLVSLFVLALVVLFTLYCLILFLLYLS